MSHALLGLVEQAMSSPWLYAALFGLALLDGFFPVVPAETAVITAGVFAASRRAESGPGDRGGRARRVRR